MVVVELNLSAGWLAGMTAQSRFETIHQERVVKYEKALIRHPFVFALLLPHSLFVCESASFLLVDFLPLLFDQVCMREAMCFH